MQKKIQAASPLDRLHAPAPEMPKGKRTVESLLVLLKLVVANAEDTCNALKLIEKAMKGVTWIERGVEHRILSVDSSGAATVARKDGAARVTDLSALRRRIQPHLNNAPSRHVYTAASAAHPGVLTIGSNISKSAKRTLVAEVGMVWIRSVLAAHRSTAKPPAVIFDIDDTLCDTAERGFDHMIRLFQMARRNSLRLHVISARPEGTRRIVLELLNRLCVGVDSENLYLMTEEEYAKKGVAGLATTTKFKNNNYEKVAAKHTVIARFGDRLWDVARPEVIRSELSECKEEDSFFCVDPVHFYLSAKLPG